VNVHTFGSSVRPGPGASSPVVEVSARYVHVRYQASDNPGRWFSGYALRVDDDVWAALTCWDREFDPMLEILGRQDGDLIAAELRKIRPALFQLIDNAVGERYGDGALVEIQDPDDFNRKWFIAKLFRASDDELDEALDTHLTQIMESSVVVLRESLNPIPASALARLGIRGAIRGAADGYRIANSLLDKFRWLSDLQGA
jgi:hypothetical protein